MKRFAAVVLASFIALEASAAVQLTYLVNQKPTPLAWTSASFPIRYTIDASAKQLLEHRAAVEQGFDAWESDSSMVAFTANAPASTKAGRNGVNSVTLTDTLFADSGFIAFTTTWFDDSGAITEADIQVDASAFTNGNLFALMQHEAGHLLGLDHSANLSSTMYPFVTRNAPPLTSDDRIGLTTLYPAQNFAVVSASLRGEVRTTTGGVFGAQVVVTDTHGSPLASTLSDQNGAFYFKSLPPGSYQIYAEPLDGPVERRNFSGIYSSANATFRTQFAAAEPITLSAGERRDGFVLDVDSLAPALNPRWVGAFAAHSDDVALNSTAASVQAGSTVSIAVGGDGFYGGMTTFEVAGGSVTRISDFKYGSNYAYATFRVAPDAPAAPLVVLVTSGNERATLTGALRVTAKASKRSRPVG